MDFLQLNGKSISRIALLQIFNISCKPLTVAVCFWGKFYITIRSGISLYGERYFGDLTTSLVVFFPSYNLNVRHISLSILLDLLIYKVSCVLPHIKYYTMNTQRHYTVKPISPTTAPVYVNFNYSRYCAWYLIMHTKCEHSPFAIVS